jgi:hypothetical protein
MLLGASFISAFQVLVSRSKEREKAGIRLEYILTELLI